MATKQPKRILSVTIKRMLDDNPDTSHLGEYSSKRTSEFSIDRAHSEDCASIIPVNKEAQQTLIRARGTIADLQSREPSSDTQEWEALEEAYNLLDGLAEESQDCDCDCDCDCGEHGDMGRHEYRYFNPSFNYVDKQGKPTDGLTPDEVRKYVRQEYERMESLERGVWCYLGIQAEAEISIPTSPASTIIPWTTSVTVWGYESDMSPVDFEQEEGERLAELKTQLRALGFSRRAIAVAFKSVERKDS